MLALLHSLWSLSETSTQSDDSNDGKTAHAEANLSQKETTLN